MHIHLICYSIDFISFPKKKYRADCSIAHTANYRVVVFSAFVELLLKQETEKKRKTTRVVLLVLFYIQKWLYFQIIAF